MARQHRGDGDRPRRRALAALGARATPRSMPVGAIVMIAIGAAIGANLRYFVSLWAAQQWGATFPYGTMLINVSGSLVIGLVMAVLTTRVGISPLWRPLVVTGLLGGFTTFSTFSYETYSQLVSGSWLAAAINVVGSVGLGLLGVILGVALARLIA